MRNDEEKENHHVGENIKQDRIDFRTHPGAEEVLENSEAHTSEFDCPATESEAERVRSEQLPVATITELDEQMQKKWEQTIMKSSSDSLSEPSP